MGEADWSRYQEKEKEINEALYGIELDQENNPVMEDVPIYPYDPDEIRIDQKMISLFQVCTWIENGKLILHPEFQRNLVWKEKQQSLLIESLMLKIPIPAFYFDEDADGVRTVIDGMQRLTTIFNFVKGKFRLRGLQYLKKCEGCTFEELEWKYSSRIEDTQLAVNILDARCPDMVKFDVFRRINTGGVTLNAQEVRNIMAKPHTRKLLKNMADSEAFQTATHGKVSDVRMGAQELCLRFITFYRLYDTVKNGFGEFCEMTSLLDQMLLRLNCMDQNERDALLKRFEGSMRRCSALFGEKAFYKPGVKTAINRALFTSFSVLLADKSHYDIEDLKKQREKANNLLERKLQEYSDYYNAITSSTSSKHNMELQFMYAKQILEEIKS